MSSPIIISGCAALSRMLNRSPGFVLRVDVLAVDEERDRPAAFDRFVEPGLEAGLQDLQQLADARDRESLAAQIREHHQLEQLDRRVAALGEAAGLGLV